MIRTTAIDPSVDGPVTDLLEVLGRTGDAMVAVDAAFRIIGWNAAATQLLGHAAEEILGRSCMEVLCWSDRCGDMVCGGLCPAAEVSDPNEVLGAREVLGKSASGRTLWLSASTIIPPLDLQDQCRLVHLIREVSLPPELERVIAEKIGGSASRDDTDDGRLELLTPREREVLQLLTEGLDGSAIAARLYVSPATVRNHIQHILAKLDVHSRVEAVAYALRR